jgi:hypothetical protein
MQSRSVAHQSLWLGYWMDCGHGQLMERLRVASHRNNFPWTVRTSPDLDGIYLRRYRLNTCPDNSHDLTGDEWEITSPLPKAGSGNHWERGMIYSAGATSQCHVERNYDMAENDGQPGLPPRLRMISSVSEKRLHGSHLRVHFSQRCRPWWERWCYSLLRTRTGNLRPNIKSLVSKRVENLTGPRSPCPVLHWNRKQIVVRQV